MKLHNGQAVEEIKRLTIGRWPELLETLGGVPRESLDGEHHPCPMCGCGTDRFRLIDEAAGAIYCNQCFKEKNGDGLAALMRLNNWSFPQTIDAVKARHNISAHCSCRRRKRL